MPKKTLNRKRSIIGSIVHLIFPETCVSCDRELAEDEAGLCSFCTSDLTLTNFQLFKDPTPVDKLFWGRVQINATYTHLFFEKHKTSQHILFNLKYKNKPQLGEYFGEAIGKILSGIPAFNSAKVIFPVPLHSKKKFIRGYNQSESIAKGISTTFGIPVDVTSVTRTKHSETQTKKTRFQRWDNVNAIFSIKKSILKYDHIIIVDDVITTGSTLESIIKELYEVHPKLSVSVVTLAIA